MAPNPSLELFRVCHDPRSISAVAHTISLSFSHDPLIRWLRPAAPPWAKSQPETCKWQYRRVQRSIVEGIVFQSASVSQLAQQFPPKPKRDNHHPRPVETVPEDDGEDAGAVVLLYPPKSRQRWTLKRIWLMIKLRLLDWLSPTPDQGGDEKRLEMLLEAHDTAIVAAKNQHRIPHLWYLEVIGVHPFLQARGVGKKTMNWVLDYINHEPVVLECTEEGNVAFYESFGFRTVEEIELNEKNEMVKCWVMLRGVACTAKCR